MWSLVIINAINVYIHMYKLFKQEAAKKVKARKYVCVLILYGMLVNFRGIKFSWILLGFLSMIANI